MAKGNGIVITDSCRGLIVEGAINGALYPGIVVQIDISEGIADDGSFTWEAYNRDADGNRPAGPLGVLMHDTLQGKIATAAYVDGDRCQVYIPVPGDQLNMMLGDVAGTGDDHTFGELLIIDDGTGELIATTGTPECEPFMLLEAVTDPTADQLVHVIFSGY